MVKKSREIDDILTEIRGYREGTFWNFVKCYQKVRLSRDEVRSLFRTDGGDIGFAHISNLMGGSSGDGFIKLCFTINPELLGEVFDPELLDGTDSDYGINWLRLTLANSGYVPSVETYDQLADSEDPFLYLFGLSVCSLDKLREYKKHKDKKARQIVFKRLGPAECLTDMLRDGTKDIRAHGVDLAPMHCENFDEMCEEVNLQICNNLLKKGDNGLVTLLMGNKNHNSNAFSGLLNFRIEEM